MVDDADVCIGPAPLIPATLQMKMPIPSVRSCCRRRGLDEGIDDDQLGVVCLCGVDHFQLVPYRGLSIIVDQWIKNSGVLPLNYKPQWQLSPALRRALRRLSVTKHGDHADDVEQEDDAEGSRNRQYGNGSPDSSTPRFQKTYRGSIYSRPQMTRR